MPVTSEDSGVAPIDDTQREAVEVNAPAQETPDRGELESKVADGLKAAFGDNTDSPSHAKEPVKEVKDAAPSDDQEQEDKPEAAAPQVEKPAATTLPAAYVRSLKAMEWTDEEIADAASNPSFLNTAAKIHNTRNKEIQAWAEMGRKNREPQQVQPAASASPKEDAGVLKPVDIAALKKQYGEDDLIDRIASPVNQAIEQINKMLPIIQQSQRNSAQSELETLGRQIESFYGSKELSAFKDVYGSVKTGLQPTQIESRNKMLEMADALMAGARVQGRQLTLDDALTLAHDSVSSDFKEQAARKTITKQLKTRERGISLKPGSRNSAPTDKVSTRRDLERNVGAGISSVFGR